MKRVSVTVNGVQEKVKFFRNDDKAVEYAKKRREEFCDEGLAKGLHLPDFGMNYNLRTGVVTYVCGLSDGTRLEALVS